jgi:hypothetical protein
MRATLTWLFALACLFGGYHFFKTESEKNAQIEAKLQEDQAVEVLPAGTEARWISYVELRMIDAVRVEQGLIKVIALGDRISRSTTLISRNTPYRIRCSPDLEISIEFGFGDDTITVPVLGVLARNENAPPLGVIKTSKAAEKLSRILCERVGIMLRDAI